MKRALLLGMLAACGGTPGKMKVDSPIMPYQPPDIGDLTGIDDDAGDSDSGSAAAPAPAPAPAPAAAPSGPPPATKPAK